MKREQGILIGTVIAAIIMMFLCSVFTFSDAVSEKALTTCIPESVSITEDGKTQYDFNLKSYGQAVARLKKGRRIEELEQFALNDSMTGMYNRNAYDYYINNEKCFDDCMVVTFDLNNLKNCNDNYGHRAGDAYIINAARIIENTFERYGKCYRIGGDEFCCIIPKGKSVDIERVIRKLYHDVDVLNNKRIIPTEVGIACGYAVFKVDDTELEKVRERADEEMYQRKKRDENVINNSKINIL